MFERFNSTAGSTQRWLTRTNRVGLDIGAFDGRVHPSTLNY